MKKLFALLICILLVFALASCGDDPCQHRDADDNSLCDKCGESYTDGKDVEDEPKYSEGLLFVFNAANSTYSVAGRGDCSDSVISIPPTYNGYPVVEISGRAFACGYDYTGRIFEDEYDLIKMTKINIRQQREIFITFINLITLLQLRQK